MSVLLECNASALAIESRRLLKKSTSHETWRQAAFNVIVQPFLYPPEYFQGI